MPSHTWWHYDARPDVGTIPFSAEGTATTVAEYGMTNKQVRAKLGEPDWIEEIYKAILENAVFKNGRLVRFEVLPAPPPLPNP
jgi:hypothetical protein